MKCCARRRVSIQDGLFYYFDRLPVLPWSTSSAHLHVIHAFFPLLNVRRERAAQRSKCRCHLATTRPLCSSSTPPHLAKPRKCQKPAPTLVPPLPPSPTPQPLPLPPSLKTGAEDAKKKSNVKTRSRAQVSVFPPFAADEKNTERTCSGIVVITKKYWVSLLKGVMSRKWGNEYYRQMLFTCGIDHTTS